MVSGVELQKFICTKYKKSILFYSFLFPSEFLKTLVAVEMILEISAKLDGIIMELFSLAVVVLLVGCAHDGGSQYRSGSIDPDPLERDIQAAVTACQVNARELDRIYDRLHNAAADEAGRSTNDLQLGYIQKTYLYVQQARLVAAYQINLLSDLPYIEEGRRADFLTLRARDLDQAISEMENAASFIDVYAVFIQDRQVLGEIEKGQQMISGTIYLYENLLAAMRPAVNPAAPFTRDHYSPFSSGHSGE